MSSESAAASTTNRPSSPMSVEDFDVYTNSQSGSVLQAEVFLSNSNVQNNNNYYVAEEDEIEEDRRYAQEDQEVSEHQDKADHDSNRRLFLTLYAVLFLAITFLVVALTRYIQFKRSIAPLAPPPSQPIPQDAATETEIMSDAPPPVEARPVEADRDRALYRSNIELILFTDLHEDCSKNFLEGPQKMAIDWLVAEDLVLNSTIISAMAESRRVNDSNPTNEDLVSSTALVQRYALMVLFFATSGELWLGFPWNELAHVHECTFSGVKLDEFSGVLCDKEDEVVGLGLAFRKLRGRLPAELGMLTKLRGIDVSNNRLDGTIPWFVYNRLTNLVHIDFSKNEFSSSISSDISKLSNLQVLNMNQNLLTGEIPIDAMKTLSSLVHISFAYAKKMRGPLFEISANWPNLTVFDIQNSGFTGTIPTTVGESTRLQTLWFEGGVKMDLSSIPTEIGLLTNLVGLALQPDNEELGGATIPTELGNCSNLRSLNGQYFSGTIPTELGRLTNLNKLNLELGSLTSLPSEIGQLTDLLHLSLKRNQLKGTLPSEFGNLQNLKELEIKFNHLTGDIPSGVCKSPSVHVNRDCIVNQCECCDADCNPEDW